MPSSLLIGALVVSWIVVLVPMAARKRQVVVRTADAALASRVLTPSPMSVATPRKRLEETRMADTEYTEEVDNTETDETAMPVEPDRRHELVDDDCDAKPRELSDPPTTEIPLPADDYVTRPYRQGRGGYDATSAERAARAQYGLRRRVVFGLLATLLLAIVLAAVVGSYVWWAVAVLAAGLVGYLSYLRRQVTIEAEIRRRRAARIRAARAAVRYDLQQEEHFTAAPTENTFYPGAMFVDYDDGDPAFDDLDEPGVLPYRYAVGQ